MKAMKQQIKFNNKIRFSYWLFEIVIVITRLIIKRFLARYKCIKHHLVTLEMTHYIGKIVHYSDCSP